MASRFSSIAREQSALMGGPAASNATTTTTVTTTGGKAKEQRLEQKLGQGQGLGQGLTTVYLATDNNTLYNLAPRDYPNVTWYKQQRQLINYTGGSFQYHNEKSANREIANLLAGE